LLRRWFCSKREVGGMPGDCPRLTIKLCSLPFPTLHTRPEVWKTHLT